MIDQDVPGTILFRLLKIPRKWMPCNGDEINQENYERLHGDGTYRLDGVDNSPLVGKSLPNIQTIGLTATVKVA